MKKYWTLIIVQLICILAAFCTCLREEESVYRIHGDEMVFSYQDEQLSFSGERIALSPGIYRVEILSGLPQDATLFADIRKEDELFNSLRSNGAVVFGCQDTFDFEVYVTAKVPSAYLVCDLKGADANAIHSVEILKTTGANRIVLLALLVGFGLLDFLILFRQGLLSGRIPQSKQVVFWTLVLCIGLAYFPFVSNYFVRGADTDFHLLRIEGLKEALLHGNTFPVRVEGYWLKGHGYANSIFYGDLFLYLPALLRILGFSLMNAYKLYVFIITVATAGIAYYSIQRCVKNEYAALFGSVLYMLAPYRLLNVYNRGAVGEFTAMAFMPLVVCGMYCLYQEAVDSPQYKKAKYLIIIGLTGIVQSHILSAEMTAFFILLVCAVLFRKTFRKETFVQLAQAAVVSLLLNSWFWVPLLKMMSADQYYMNNLVNGRIQEHGIPFVRLWQVFSNRGYTHRDVYQAEPIQLGIAPTLLLIGFIVWVAVQRYRRTQKENGYRKQTLFMAVLTCVTVVLGTCYFPWDFLATVPGVRFLVTALQFPYRMLAPGTVFTAFFAAWFVLWLPAECEQRQSSFSAEFICKGIQAVTMLFAVVTAVYYLNDFVYGSGATYLYTAENLGTISVGNGEYVLADVDYGAITYHDPVAEGGMEWTAYEQKGTEASLIISNETDSLQHLEFPLMGYAGYVLECPGSEETAELPYITQERGAHGDLRVAVPAGFAGEICVRYEGFTCFRVAEIISLLTLLGLIVTGMRNKKCKIQ